MYTVTTNNIHIVNSFEIKSRKEMKKLLEKIKSEYPDCAVFKRKFSSLISE